MTYPLDCKLVKGSRVVGISGTLVDSETQVWSGILSKVVNFPITDW